MGNLTHNGFALRRANCAIKREPLYLHSTLQPGLELLMKLMNNGGAGEM